MKEALFGGGTMVDTHTLHRVQQWFCDYVDGFLTGDPHADQEVQARCAHTWRVAADAARLAVALDLDPAGVRRAELLGVLHDTGRFEQLRRTGICRDTPTEDHACLGVRILGEQGVLDTLDRAEADRVELAVSLHNRCRLPHHLPPTAGLWVHLLRDADKLDILGHSVRTYLQGHPLPTQHAHLHPTTNPTPRVLHAALAGTTVPHAWVRTVGDLFLVQCCWLGELHHPAARRLARDRRLLEAFRAALPGTPDLQALWHHLDAA